MGMTKRQREVVFRIRELKRKEKEYGGQDSFDWAELVELQAEANRNGWVYW